MSITKFKDVYHISNGVFLTFANNMPNSLLYVNHSNEKIESLKFVCPIIKVDRIEFILLCVYIMYKFSPSCVFDLWDRLREITIENDGYIEFKTKIKFYRNILVKDLIFLTEKYNNIKNEDYYIEFNKNNISLITMYWLIKLNYITSKSINENFIIEKIFNVVKFLCFKDSSIIFIKNEIKKYLEPPYI